MRNTEIGEDQFLRTSLCGCSLKITSQHLYLMCHWQNFTGRELKVIDFYELEDEQVLKHFHMHILIDFFIYIHIYVFISISFIH